VADHYVKMWDSSASIVVVNVNGAPVAKLYVEQSEEGVAYVELEMGRLINLDLTNKLFCMRYGLECEEPDVMRVMRETMREHSVGEKGPSK
jgi:hypothetical protein